MAPLFSLNKSPGSVLISFYSPVFPLIPCGASSSKRASIAKIPVALFRSLERLKLQLVQLNCAPRDLPEFVKLDVLGCAAISGI